MTTKIDKEQKKELKNLFDEYCILIYKRTYPMTNKNLFNYFLDFYMWRFNGSPDTIHEYFKYPVIEITKDYFNITGIYCIRNGRLWAGLLMKDFNEYLKDDK